MNFKEFLTEGAFVIKNKDGKEKRFPKIDSPAAIEWANSQSEPKKTKVKYAAYSDGYWYSKLDSDPDRLTPFDPIKTGEITREVLASMKNIGLDEQNIDSWTIVKRDVLKVEHTTCATANIRITAFYSKEDDLGLEDDASDLVSVQIRRDEKDPKKFKFVKSI